MSMDRRLSKRRPDKHVKWANRAVALYFIIFVLLVLTGGNW